MARKADGSAKAQRKLTLLALCGALALGLPTAGMALAGKSAPVKAAAATRCRVGRKGAELARVTAEKSSSSVLPPLYNPQAPRGKHRCMH